MVTTSLLKSSFSTLASLSMMLLAQVGFTPVAHSASLEPFALRSQRGPDGKFIALKAPAEGAAALVFYSSECPISNAYSPTLKRLATEYPSGKVNLIGVCVDTDLSDADLLTHAKDFDLTFPVISDRNGLLAAKLGATVTPEAFVIDSKGLIRYHGRIDDQFASRQKPNANPSTHELKDALDAVLAGRDVVVVNVEAVGCPIPAAPQSVKPPTYAKEVSRILQKNCQECHRKGQVGPFALETYEQARKRAGDLATVTQERSMPPWKPAPGVGPKIKHDRSLSPADIATLTAWATASAPLGNPADMPSPAKFPSDWALGTPDLVITPSEDFSIAAEGADIYRCFVIPTSLPKDMYISGIEYQPGNRRVVHHMLGFVDVSGEARKRDAADPGQGYTCFSGPEVRVHGGLGGWAPGNEPSILPDGIGRSLPQGSDVILQLHYHPTGKPETDRSRIGLYFSKKPVKEVLHWGAVLNEEGLRLPPGEANIEIKGEWSIPIDLVAYGITPHMHLLGRDMLLSVKYPDGRVEPLVRIDDWDFAWQNTYYFEKPLDIPKGSTVHIVAHYDNSSTNPRNPHKPPKVVTWGEATTDEMCIGFLAITKKGQDLTRAGEKDDLQEILFKQLEDSREPSKKEGDKKESASKPVKGK